MKMFLRVSSIVQVFLQSLLSVLEQGLVEIEKLEILTRDACQWTVQKFFIEFILFIQISSIM
jgi:hypothetical protein